MSSIRNVEGVSRGNSYTVDPRTIKVDWSSNPRKDYGTEEEIEQLKADIKQNGLLVPLVVYLDKVDNSLNLGHGFRRMKAILSLIEEGVEINKVPIMQVENNKIAILAYHFSLNSGKNFNIIEQVDAVVQMYKYNDRNIKATAERLGWLYQKVDKFVKFGLEATEQIRNRVLEGKLSFNMAYDIVTKSNGTDEQVEVLNKALKNASINGNKKVKTTDLPSDATVTKKRMTAKIDLTKSIKAYINFLNTTDEIAVSVKDLLFVIDELENGTPIDEIIAKAMENE